MRRVRLALLLALLVVGLAVPATASAASEPSAGSVVVVGKDAVVTGRVDRVVAVAGDVRLGPRAVVREDVIVLFGTLHAAPGAQVEGSRYVVSGSLVDWLPGPAWVAVVLVVLLALAYRVLVWLAVRALASTAVRTVSFERWSHGWEGRPAIALAAGALALAIVLPALALVAATGFGLPVAIMGLAVLLVAAGGGLAMLREGPLWPRRPGRAAYAAYLLVPPALEMGLLISGAAGLGAALRGVTRSVAGRA